MQTIRSYSARLSFDEASQDHTAYVGKKNLIEKGLLDIKKRHVSSDGQIVSAGALFDEKNNITACFYRGQIFLGFQDKATKEVSFNDDICGLVGCSDTNLNSLIDRLDIALTGYKNNGVISPVAKQFNSAWEAKQPILDKIIDYELEFSLLSETKQSVKRNTGLYDQEINDILNQESPTVSLEQPQKESAPKFETKSFAERVKKAKEAAEKTKSASPKVPVKAKGLELTLPLL